MKVTIVTVHPDESVEIGNLDTDSVMSLIEAFETGESVLHLSLDEQVETYILRSNIIRIDVEPA